MLLSKEDSQIEQVLLQTKDFYSGKFEASWSAHLRESGSTYFDKISDVDRFAGSITTAGGLMALGSIDSASRILGRALPTISDLLTSQHPQYITLWRISASVRASESALGRLRSQVK